MINLDLLLQPDVNWADTLVRLYPELHQDSNGEEHHIMAKTVTLQITDDCCMACTYCYQHNKAHHFMSFETAKTIIDFLLDPNNTYINPTNSPGIILDFIGGEPLLAIDLIKDTADYFTRRCIELNHPWLFKHRFSICTNGLLYFNPKVQEFLSQYNQRTAFTITIDGDKELHDSCRVDLEGNGTYDRARAAATHFQQHYSKELGSKMTIAPANITHVADAVKDFFHYGHKSIMLNCVYEEGWTIEHAKILYQQLKELANWVIANRYYLDHSIRLFDYHQYHPLDEGDENNWCGGVGESMLAFDYKGDIFPCLRYMESSLANTREPIIIGNLEHGIYYTDKEKAWAKELNGVTRSCQSTTECFNCPIAAGCSWCSAYNYECFGTVRKRATFICPMHKATALANVYYWNLLLIMENDERRFKNYVPDEWALQIISEKELQLIKFLETFPTDIDISELLKIQQEFSDINLQDLISAYREIKNNEK